MEIPIIFVSHFLKGILNKSFAEIYILASRHTYDEYNFTYNKILNNKIISTLYLE